MTKPDFGAAQAIFDATLSAQPPVAALEQVWGQVQKSAGPFRRAGSAHVESSPTQDVLFMVCEFEKTSLDLRLPLDKAGHIHCLTFGRHVDYTPTY